MGIKRITAANENLVSGRSRTEAQQYWAESHGKLVANNAGIQRYHHYFSLPEAYENEPKASYIGISMFWRSDLDVMFKQQIQPNVPANGTDDRQLFDRDPRWPTDDQHADIFGDENIIIDGAKTPSMVNVIVMVCRKPGLDHQDFFRHWTDVQVPLASKLPGLRRYIQCPVALDSVYRGSSTHDGWSEFWFDDYAAFQQAYKSPEWAAMEADGDTLFMKTQALRHRPRVHPEGRIVEAPRLRLALDVRGRDSRPPPGPGLRRRCCEQTPTHRRRSRPRRPRTSSPSGRSTTSSPRTNQKSTLDRSACRSKGRVTTYRIRKGKRTVYNGAKAGIAIYVSQAP